MCPRENVWSVRFYPQFIFKFLLFTWTQHEQNYGELASSRLQWIMYTAKMTLASMIGKYEIQAKIALASMVGMYEIQAKMTLASMVGKYEIQAKMTLVSTKYRQK